MVRKRLVAFISAAAVCLVGTALGPASALGLDPILFVHGFSGSSSNWSTMIGRFEKEGWPKSYLSAYTYNTSQSNKVDAEKEVKSHVESLLKATGASKVDIVAHSMGGLVALDYLKRGGGAPHVRRLVLMGTPARGTWSALLGLMTAPLGKGGRQLLPGSEFLRELDSTPLPPGPEVITLSGDRDWLAPPRTTRIRGARRVDVATGHSGFLVDEAVAETVEAILTAPDRPAVTL